jgi:signal transduction histidine kinase
VPDVVSNDRDTRWIGQRIKLQSKELSSRWLERLDQLLVVDRRLVFPSHQLLDHIPELIQRIASYVEDPRNEEIAASAPVMQKAAELGTLRYQQHASVHQLLREYQFLAEVLEDFVLEEVTASDTADAVAVVHAMRRVAAATRVLQQQTVDTFVAEYTQTIERQTEQLRKFSRLVSHEIRQPLAVLQVIAKALPVRDGDLESARMMDIFNRNVVRLTDVTGKLERLARITRSIDLSPNEQDVDLTGLVSGVARQLADMAAARDVRVVVQPDLPRLHLDPARAELVFINIIANGIKYSDADKPDRFVEVYRSEGEASSVIVRDNGVGIAAARLQHIFREFVRAHAHRHDEVNPRGLGLGLSIVRECMDAANGSVRIESVEGQGTSFKLTWPAR